MSARRTSFWIITASVGIVLIMLLLLRRGDERFREIGEIHRIVGVAHGEIFYRDGADGRYRAETILEERSRSVQIAESTAGNAHLTALPGGRTLLAVDEPELARLWDVSPNVGNGRELLAQLPKRRLAITGNLCFWMKHLTTRAVVETVAGRKIKGQRTIGDLMVTSIDRGETRRIAAGVDSSTALEPVGDGISWRGPLERGDTYASYYVAFPPEYQVRRIRNVGSNMYAVGKRLTWVDTPNQTSSVPSERTVVTCDRGGNDRRVLTRMGFATEWLQNYRMLEERDGGLLCIFNRRLVTANGTYAGMAPHLARMEDSAIVPLKRLPEGVLAFYVDEKHLYYLVPQRRDDWFDWSPSGLLPKVTWMLYRTSIPKS
jgi:hypothetical protein